MNITATKEEIAAAAAYEDLHVPALFRQWAPRILDTVQFRPGCRVLDVACGTGVLAREALLRVDDKGFVAGVDANAGMLTIAQQLAPSVAWHKGVAESLPYEADSFDIVVSQFGFMFFQDRPKALREMIRVLAPGGQGSIAVWDNLDHSEAYPGEVVLLQRLAGEHAADALRAPFVLGDLSVLTQLFQDAGLNSVKLTTHKGMARFPSIRSMVEADLRGWLPVMGVVLSAKQIDMILQEAEHVLRRYITSEGTIEFETQAHIATFTV